MVMKMNILILGIGNPILTDDAVGVLVARSLSDVDAVVEEASIGGVALLDFILGYDKVILVDGVKKSDPPGTVSILDQNQIKRALHASSTHDMAFSEAIELGYTVYPDEMPSEIVVVGIEVQDVTTVSETPTEPVRNAVPEAVQTIKTLVETWRQHQK